MINVKIQSPATLPPPPQMLPSSEQTEGDLSCLDKDSSGDNGRWKSGDPRPSSLFGLGADIKCVDGEDDEDEDESDVPMAFVESDLTCACCCCCCLFFFFLKGRTLELSAFSVRYPSGEWYFLDLCFFLLLSFFSFLIITSLSLLLSLLLLLLLLLSLLIRMSSLIVIIGGITSIPLLLMGFPDFFFSSVCSRCFFCFLLFFGVVSRDTVEALIVLLAVMGGVVGDSLGGVLEIVSSAATTDVVVDALPCGSNSLSLSEPTFWTPSLPVLLLLLLTCRSLP